MSGSVPELKVMVTETDPLESLVEAMYSMPSRPVIACSMICVTEFSTACAEAPG